MLKGCLQTCSGIIGVHSCDARHPALRIQSQPPESSQLTGAGGLREKFCRGTARELNFCWLVSEDEKLKSDQHMDTGHRQQNVIA